MNLIHGVQPLTRAILIETLGRCLDLVGKFRATSDVQFLLPC